MNTLARKFATLLIIFAFFANIVTPIVTNAGFGNFSDDTKDNFEDGVVMCAATAAILMVISYIAGGMNVPTANIADTIKDTILDCLFWAFKNAIIQEMTGSTVQWIQTGMNGNPAFVQNVGAYLRSVADREAGRYIQKVAPFLCTPFRADIQLQLDLLYKNSSGRGPVGINGSSCTLSESVDNIDQFLEGDFYAGGWDGWQSMFSNPQNNPYGAYFEARNELSLRLKSASGEEEKKLSFGNGFLSKEIQNCYDTTETLEDGTVVTYKECDPPQVLTPGAQVKNSLEQAFEVNLDQIASADEFDEIFSLLAAWLISDILTQDGGLAEYDPAKVDHELPPPPAGGDLCIPVQIGAGRPGQPSGLLVNEPQAFTSTAENPTREIDIDIPPGQNYSRVTAEFDLTTAPQTAPDNASQLNLFWLHRGPNIAQSEWGANDVAEVVLNTENGQVRFATSINSCEMLERSERSPFRDNLTYHVVVDYNPGDRTMSVKVDGSTLISQATSVDVLQSGDQNGRGGFFIKLGNAENASADEGLTDGWTWANLRVTFEPGDTTVDPGDDDDNGDDDDDNDPPQNEEAGLVEALHIYAKTGVKPTEQSVLKYLRPQRTEGWNSFGGSQNLSPMAFAAMGDYQFFQELAGVEESEGIGSREFGSPGFYFSMPIAAKIVALRDARAAGDSAAANAIARNLLETWTVWSMVAIEGQRTSITANSGGTITTSGGDSQRRGLVIAVAGDRWNSTGTASSYQSSDLETILSWALDVPRSGNNRSLRQTKDFWWDTIIAHAIGVDRYSDSTSPEVWGMTAQDRSNLQKLVRGDTSVLPWALSIVSPGLFERYNVRMRRTTEGVETVLLSSSNGNKPAQAATSITNGGVVHTMRPCVGNASGQNQGYNVTIADSTVTATGNPDRCFTVSQPELGGSVIYEVNFDDGRVN